MKVMNNISNESLNDDGILRIKPNKLNAIYQEKEKEML